MAIRKVGGPVFQKTRITIALPHSKEGGGGGACSFERDYRDVEFSGVVSSLSFETVGDHQRARPTPVPRNRFQHSLPIDHPQVCSTRLSKTATRTPFPRTPLLDMAQHVSPYAASIQSSSTLIVLCDFSWLLQRARTAEGGCKIRHVGFPITGEALLARRYLGERHVVRPDGAQVIHWVNHRGDLQFPIRLLHPPIGEKEREGGGLMITHSIFFHR